VKFADEVQPEISQVHVLEGRVSYEEKKRVLEGHVIMGKGCMREVSGVKRTWCGCYFC
jgi:hypothetical protein